MDKETSVSLARRASPYSLAVLPDPDTYEYTDPHNEAAVQQRWQRRCEQHGAAVLGIRDVPTSPVWVDLDGVRWLLGPLGDGERWVPAEVFHRWRALEAAEVPFFYWLWGEEQPQRPNLRPLPARGTVATTGLAQPARPRDPILIGVIPTAPNRGLWVLIGRWFH